jgi:NAD(P)-dependent dehydrogenase (short-subunit alcohol dehydrogenase family)
MGKKRVVDTSPIRKAVRLLSGKIALVTGGSRGIGLAIATKLATAGAKVVITGRDESSLVDAAAQISRAGGKAVTRHCDVRNLKSVAALFSAVREEFRHLDILINNAGVAQPNMSVADMPLELWQEVIETNLTGLFLCSKAALPLMRTGATIVNNLSVSARHVFPSFSAYTASKHGALGFTNSLREELRPRGIRVIALMPGATDTGIWDQFWPEAPRDRMMSAESVADALLSAILLPENTSVDELLIMPTTGSL